MVKRITAIFSDFNGFAMNFKMSSEDAYIISVQVSEFIDARKKLSIEFLNKNALKKIFELSMQTHKVPYRY